MGWFIPGILMLAMLGLPIFALLTELLPNTSNRSLLVDAEFEELAAAGLNWEKSAKLSLLQNTNVKFNKKVCEEYHCNYYTNHCNYYTNHCNYSKNHCNYYTNHCNYYTNLEIHKKEDICKYNVWIDFINCQDQNSQSKLSNVRFIIFKRNHI